MLFNDKWLHVVVTVVRDLLVHNHRYDTNYGNDGADAAATDSNERPKFHGWCFFIRMISVVVTIFNYAFDFSHEHKDHHSKDHELGCGGHFLL